MTGSPTGREPYGDRAIILLVGVTTHWGGEGNLSTGGRVAGGLPGVWKRPRWTVLTTQKGRPLESWMR